MENKTNRIQNKKDTTVILSDIEQQVREGKCFFPFAEIAGNKVKDLLPENLLTIWKML